MKATGIVRRIDDLGRVVVPKEIRRTLRIREGDPLEIFTDREGEIILKKYSPIGELGAFAKQYADALAQSCGHIVSITDRDHHIAVSGAARKELLGQPVGPALENLINQRETRCCVAGDRDFIPISTQEKESFTAQMCVLLLPRGRGWRGDHYQPDGKCENGRGGAETGFGCCRFSWTSTGTVTDCSSSQCFCLFPRYTIFRV